VCVARRCAWRDVVKKAVVVELKRYSVRTDRAWVLLQKYLGIILDAQLDFSLQAQYAAGKAKRASAKVSTLYDGREGIPVQTGIALYKTLVRLHVEYAIPVWATMSSGDLGKLEKVQAQCLRQIIGAKAHSSTAAIEVVTGIVPVRIQRIPSNKG